MNTFDYGNYTGANEVVFASNLGYNDPSSEVEARKQLSKPLQDIKNFINTNIVPNFPEFAETEISTLESGFSLYQSTPIKVTKQGKVINITGTVLTTEAKTGVTVKICDIPENYRPKYAQRAIMQASANGSSDVWGCSIKTDGELDCVRYTQNGEATDIPNGAWMMFSMTYIGG